ncbi:MAG: Rdx family protein [Actinomycetia bacterium]|nr:Rdx family protein [Actinomycetes bacterium]
MRTADQLLDEFERTIDRLILIPSSGGRFEVMLDERLIYSKAETGLHAEYEDIAGPLREILT